MCAGIVPWDEGNDESEAEGDVTPTARHSQPAINNRWSTTETDARSTPETGGYPQSLEDKVEGNHCRNSIFTSLMLVTGML